MKLILDKFNNVASKAAQIAQTIETVEMLNLFDELDKVYLLKEYTTKQLLLAQQNSVKRNVKWTEKGEISLNFIFQDGSNLVFMLEGNIPHL